MNLEALRKIAAESAAHSPAVLPVETFGNTEKQDSTPKAAGGETGGSDTPANTATPAVTFTGASTGSGKNNTGANTGNISNNTNTNTNNSLSNIKPVDALTSLFFNRDKSTRRWSWGAGGFLLTTILANLLGVKSPLLFGLGGGLLSGWYGGSDNVKPIAPKTSEQK